MSQQKPTGCFTINVTRSKLNISGHNDFISAKIAPYAPKTTETNILKSYSKWPPPAFTAAANRLLKSRTAARTTASVIFCQALIRDRLRSSIFLCGLEQASFSSTDHIVLSIGFRSGDNGGHWSLVMKPGQLSSHHCWVTRAVWLVAPSC